MQFLQIYDLNFLLLFHKLIYEAGIRKNNVLLFTRILPVSQQRRNDMSVQKLMKSYEELSYRDDFMFGKVMEDSELCREVLECLLQHPISELKEVQTQRELQYSVDGKPIRLDLYNEDSEGRVYDVEMQNLNHKKPEDLQLPRRSRFYQASIDIDYMDKVSRIRSFRKATCFLYVPLILSGRD